MMIALIVRDCARWSLTWLLQYETVSKS